MTKKITRKTPKVGDLIRVKLLNGMYMFVDVVFDVPKNTDMMKSYFYFYASCFLTNIYAQISHEKELKDDILFCRGMFITRKDLKNCGEILLNREVDYTQIDFPETTGGEGLQKGELDIGIIPDEKLTEWNDKFNGGFSDVYSVADSILYMQGRKSEMQRTYGSHWKFIPSDFRFYPEYRKEVFKIIGEDPNLSYYELSLKHGFDLARYYKK